MIVNNGTLHPQIVDIGGDDQSKEIRKGQITQGRGERQTKGQRMLQTAHLDEVQSPVNLDSPLHVQSLAKLASTPTHCLNFHLA